MTSSFTMVYNIIDEIRSNENALYKILKVLYENDEKILAMRIRDNYKLGLMDARRVVRALKDIYHEEMIINILKHYEELYPECTI